jgi:alginate O-acetyltransferase complex protein AlgI
MSIDSPLFFLFLIITYGACALAADSQRKYVLLGASCGFYALAGVFSALATASLIAVNYVMMTRIARSRCDDERDRLYSMSIIVNIAVFVALKLALEPSLAQGESASSGASSSIAYPLGLSFIVLILHGAITDVHAGGFAWRGGLSDLALHCLFFPYVTAGPIPRLSKTVETLAPPRPALDDALAGGSLIALGLVEKLVIANRIEPYVTNLFDPELHYSSLTLLTGILLNAAYIYSDFSGYTDIARGAARCLGIRLGINFDRPFRSRSVTEFWRRWHISFSSWLRDYIAMPLEFTFRRHGLLGTSLALISTFVICGFWHRATPTFIVFGVLHGIAVTMELIAARYLPAGVRTAFESSFGTLLKHIYTTSFLLATMVLFSAPSLADAIRVFSDLLSLGAAPRISDMYIGKGPFLFALLLLAAASAYLLSVWRRDAVADRRPLFFLAASLLILFLGNPVAGGFVYAQF